MRRILFTTVVGSDMWGARHPGSDTDQFNVFVAPTRDILRGQADVKSYEDHERLHVDAVYHEVGHVVDLLLTGNINMVWGVMSPVVLTVEEEPPYFYAQFRDIVSKHTGSNIYNSTMGLVKFLDKDIGKADDEYHANKKRRIGVRSARFVTTYLRHGVFHFAPMPYDTVVTQTQYEDAKNELDAAFKATDIPEKPNPEPYRDWLERVRTDDWTKAIYASKPMVNAPAMAGTEGT